MSLVVRRILVLAVAISLCACRQAPAPEKVAPAGAGAARSVAPDMAHGVATVAAELPTSGGCVPGREQRGPGCDMEAIIAAIKPLRQPGAAIPRCYLDHVQPARPGKLKVRFRLEPAGRPADWQWTLDEFGLPALQACLQEALATAVFPAPGDKPCQVVYPFTFIPEARSGK